MELPNVIADRYVRLWNEQDPEARRAAVEALYHPEAVYVFYRKDPVVGHAAIVEQLAYTQHLYRPMGYSFRSSNNAVGHHDLVRFNWVMVAFSGEVEMIGQDVLVLGPDGRIRYDYQFHDRLPTSFAYNDGFETAGVATRPAEPTLVSPQ